jgi:hypothetical protein
MTPVPRWSKAEQCSDYHLAVSLGKQFCACGYETEIRILPEWENEFEGRYVLVLRGLGKYKPKPEHINIVWNISNQDKIPFAEYELYDAVFVESLSCAKTIQKLANVPVHPLFQCTDAEYSGVHENDKRYEVSAESMLECFLRFEKIIKRDFIQMIFRHC